MTSPGSSQALCYCSQAGSAIYFWGQARLRSTVSITLVVHFCHSCCECARPTLSVQIWSKLPGRAIVWRGVPQAAYWRRPGLGEHVGSISFTLQRLCLFSRPLNSSTTEHLSWQDRILNHVWSWQVRNEFKGKIAVYLVSFGGTDSSSDEINEHSLSWNNFDWCIPCYACAHEYLLSTTIVLATWCRCVWTEEVGLYDGNACDV